jgi:uncharacterized FAD-dependent dehydrogenase
LKYFLKDCFGCFSVGVRIEVENDAMAQNCGRDGIQIVDTEVQAIMHQSEYASAFDESLGAAR